MIVLFTSRCIHVIISKQLVNNLIGKSHQSNYEYTTNYELADHDRISVKNIWLVNSQVPIYRLE